MATASERRPLRLETPMSATFPSEIQSPATMMSPTLLKREEVEKTPISPPAAYLSFLSKMTTTPPSTSPPPSSSILDPNLSDRPTLISHHSVDSVSSAASTTSDCSTETTDSEASEKTETTEQSEASKMTGVLSEAESTCTSTQTTRPSSPRMRSLSCAEVSTMHSSAMGRPTSRPVPRPLNIPLPMSPYSPGPESARSLKRLQIPHSPYSPRMASPSITSPMITSPLSAGGMVSPFSSAYSPRDRDFGSGAVGLRQTITRYISIPNKTAPVMEPVPVCKKRKIEQS